MNSFNIFFQSYLETALWASSDINSKNNEPLDKNYCVYDFDDVCLEKLRNDCKEFYSDNYELIKSNLRLAGHDFFLTSNGHGAGFWDGDWEEEIGKKLTEESHKYNEVNFWVSEGKIHCD